jgi:hypothetical protein
MNSTPTCRTWLAVALSCTFLWANVSQAQSLPSSSVKPEISVRISVDRPRFRPGEDIRLHVELRNESDRDLFIYKTIDYVPSNALAKIELTVYRGNQAVWPMFSTAGDCFCSERSTYPPLASELSRDWIALSPQHYYGGDVLLRTSSFEKLRVPGRYRIQGKYSSRGFLAKDINNPLLHYAEELKQLPYEAWVGEVETNSLWIEITNKRP